MAEFGQGDFYGHYRVLRRDADRPWRLGEATVGDTFKALDTRSGQLVALRVINAFRFRNPAARARFLRAVEAAASVRHRHVASVGPPGASGDAIFYATEFVDGETVAEFVGRRGPLPPAEALAIALQVCSALVAVHEKGIVHRDLKPTNLRLAAYADDAGGGGETALVKLIDFGLSKGSIKAGARGEGDSGFRGSPLFASPEQCDGLVPDARSDIYSLGVTLWFLLAAGPPFVGSAEEICDQHREESPPFGRLRAAQCPPPMRALLERLLAKDPADRPRTSGEVRDWIKDFLLHWAAPPASVPAFAKDPAGIDPTLLWQVRVGLVGRQRRSPQLALGLPTRETVLLLRRNSRALWRLALGLFFLVAVVAVLVVLFIDSRDRSTLIATRPRIIPPPASPPPAVASPTPAADSAQRKATGPSASPTTTPAPVTAATPRATPTPEPSRADPKAAAVALNRRGVELFARGQKQRAIEAFNDAIRLDPNLALAHNNRGCAYAELGDKQRALADLDEAVRLDVTSATAYNSRGDLYASLGKAPRAIEDFDEALRLDPTFAEAYNNRGSVYSSLGNKARAVEDYNKAIEFNPRFAQAYYNRSVAQSALGNRKLAQRDLAKARELERSRR